MPTAPIERIMARRPPPGLRSAALLSSLLIAAALAFASLVHVEQVVEIDGEIASLAPRITITSGDLAVVETMAGASSTRVAQGDVLAVLRPLEAETTLRAHLVEALQARVQLLRLDAETADAPLPEKTPEALLTEATAAGVDAAPLWAAQRDLARSRAAALAEQRRAIGEALERLRRTRTLTEAQRATLARRAAVRAEIEASRAALERSGSGSRVERLMATDALLETEGDLAEADRALAALDADLAREAARLIAVEEGFRLETAREREDAQRRLSAAEGRLSVDRARSETATVVAPQDAIVLQRADAAPGSVIQRGALLFVLSPLEGALVARLEIPAREIARVRGRETARLKLRNLPFQRHGHLDARIVSITADTVARPRPGGGEEPVYLANAEILDTSRLIDTPPGFALTPGMQVTADVLTGRRRLISYFTYPLTAIGARALREPGTGA